MLQCPTNKSDPLFKVLENSYKELMLNQKTDAKSCRKKLSYIPMNKCAPSDLPIQHHVEWGDAQEKLVSGQLNEKG
jgi:hypothetical protein